MKKLICIFVLFNHTIIVKKYPLDLLLVEIARIRALNFDVSVSLNNL